MLEKLFKYHGSATNHFTGDECLSGDSPIQGAELCSVAEAMYSYETLFAITGNVKWLDILESLAFNAFPATNSADMWTHQYDQMINQITCRVFPNDKNIFKTNGPASNTFGFEPNYACCTANLSQAFPKFALSSFYKSADGIVSAVPVPSEVDTEINGVKVSIKLDTLYPFRNKLKYTITTEKPVNFTFGIRVPSTVTKVIEEERAKPGTIFNVTQTWSGINTIYGEFETTPVFIERPRGMYVLKNGPLLYSVAIDEDWKKISDADYEVYPKSKWNYAYKKNGKIKVVENDTFDKPFSHTSPPVLIEAEMYEIDWGIEDGYEDICALVPHDTKPLSAAKSIKLYPYGCTALRITEAPIID
jgi:hypothetical protein